MVEDGGAAVMDFEAELAAPLGEGAFGDAEFGGDADEAPALGAALDRSWRFLLECCNSRGGLEGWLTILAEVPKPI